MDLLILGGTIFLGKHIAEYALARGHNVTLFNRGMHDSAATGNTAELSFTSRLERLKGSRDGGLDALVGRCWDVVVDTCGYVPRIVRDSAHLLRDSTDLYIFISSISVYPEFGVPGIDESTAVGKLEDPTVEQVTAETYGPLKALCEQAAEQEMPGRVLNVRPGLIVGPDDPTDRFTYWPVRVASGGKVIAPARANYPIQVIDVRDLAEWIVRMAESKTAGVYNTVSPPGAITLGAVMVAGKEVSGSNAEFVWATEAFLEQNSVSGWSDLPVWVPETAEYAGFHSINCDRAVAKGLTMRPIRDTVEATLNWATDRFATTNPVSSVKPTMSLRDSLRAGLSAARERELIDLWYASQTGS